jgi:hypothetical protein
MSSFVLERTHAATGQSFLRLPTDTRRVLSGLPVPLHPRGSDGALLEVKMVLMHGIAEGSRASRRQDPGATHLRSTAREELARESESRASSRALSNHWTPVNRVDVRGVAAAVGAGARRRPHGSWMTSPKHSDANRSAIGGLRESRQ